MNATVYEVQGQLEGRSHLAGLDHFDLRRIGEVSADRVLGNANLTLYAFDDDARCAVFVETPPEIDLTAAPFYYLVQKEPARSVYTLPYRTFNELARTLPDPEHLILLHSVGRCGSTLLCRALGALGDVVTLSEPDTYTRIPGIRPFDGSRDAELTELIGSATRFHCRALLMDAHTTWLLKLRGWCSEMADLLYAAFPNASTLFLSRDLEGWMRSMGRLVRLGDPKREAHYRSNKGSLNMYVYPRDRYISLLRTDPTPPETRLEDLALGWTSLVTRYLDLYQRGIISHSLSYNDLTGNPEAALRVVAQVCNIPTTHLKSALEVFAHDSQADTHLSGRMLREQKDAELSEADVKRAKAVALRHGREPDIAANLPGNLLSA